MHCSIFLRKKVVYIPTSGRTSDGIHVDQEPFAVVPVGDTTALHQAIKGTIERGNPPIPHPDWTKDRGPQLPQVAGVKSWKTFYQGTETWSVTFGDDRCEIMGSIPLKGGGWRPDLKNAITLPAGTTIDELCTRVVAIIQAKAAEMT